MNETGKRQKPPIELGYYRTPDRMLRLRRALYVIAIACVAGGLLAAGISDRNANSHPWSIVPRRIASKGPVAKPHAMWDSNCEACHESFVPINGSRCSPLFWTSSSAEKTKCKNCHPGPAHHQSLLKNEVPDCAVCHREHRGREASLLAVDNSNCTICHQNLPSHRDSRRSAADRGRQETRGCPRGTGF